MTPHLSVLLTLLWVVAVLYWFWQAIRVLLASTDVFDSHAEKLLWFVTVVFLPVFGAIGFSVWHHRKIARDAQQSADATLRSIAEAYQGKKGS